jgi:hypothetical protein
LVLERCPDNVDETATMQQDAVRQSYPAFNIQQGRGEHLFNFEQWMKGNLMG